jgi:copper(I)-binding protein
MVNMTRGWSFASLAWVLALAGPALARDPPAAPAGAEVTVTEAWVGPTMPRLNAAGVYMKLTGTKDVLLVSAASPAAGIVEIHEMTMGGGVMVMRSIDEVPIPAGTTVELKPGGFHVMLMELRKPLAKGDKVPVTLIFRGADGKKSTLEVKAEVRAMAGAPARK